MTNENRNWNDSIPEASRTISISDSHTTKWTVLESVADIDDAVRGFGRSYDFHGANEPVEIELSAHYYLDGTEMGTQIYIITNVCPDCGNLYSRTVAAHECSDRNEEGR
jgi:hypothetical protein